MSSFAKAIEYCVEREGGGYTDYAEDYGGPTKWGITAARLAEYQQITGRLRGKKVHQLLKSDALAIYYLLYWHHMMEGIISPEITAKLLDFRIMRGVKNGTITTQMAVNSQWIYTEFFCPSSCDSQRFDIAVDGIFGAQTMNAINDSCPQSLMVAMMMEIGTHHARHTRDSPRDQRIFISGWINRTFMFPGVSPKEIEK